MSNLIIVVADAARCRIYSHEPSSGPPVDHEPELREVVDLIEPERRLRPRERHGEKQGTGVSPTGVGFGLDDRRDSHEREIERRFAAEIVDELSEVLESTSCRRTAIVAGPHMLGLLRAKMTPLAKRGVEVHEVSLDLNSETTARIHDHLASAGVLPVRQRIGA